MNEKQYLKWKPIGYHRQGYISVINNSFKWLVISLIDYNYYKIRTRTQKMATQSNTLQLAQKTDGVLNKVHVFWEGHKNWQNLHRQFDSI